MPDQSTVSAEIGRAMHCYAEPDSRFHFDFSQFIPGFTGSDAAALRLTREPAYRYARHLFVTPDNSLIPFRECLIADRKTMVVPSYGLHRGFILVDGITVPNGAAPFAAWLDGIEHFGRPVTLAELKTLGLIDLVVTGAAAVTAEGLRFGMGHAYLDLEWGILSEIGVVGEAIPIAAIVHDIQVRSERFPPTDTDVLADVIVTPTRTIHAPAHPRPTVLSSDLVWPAVAATPPLRELRERAAATV